MNPAGNRVLLLLQIDRLVSHFVPGALSQCLFGFLSIGHCRVFVYFWALMVLYFVELKFCQILLGYLFCRIQPMDENGIDEEEEDSTMLLVYWLCDFLFIDPPPGFESRDQVYSSTCRLDQTNLKVHCWLHELYSEIWPKIVLVCEIIGFENSCLSSCTAADPDPFPMIRPSTLERSLEELKEI